MNVLIRDIDKNAIHNQCIVETENHINCKEVFRYVLDVKSIAKKVFFSIEDEISTLRLEYDLSVRLLNHFDLIDRLIELFLCFEINLIRLSEKANYDLYLFNVGKTDMVATFGSELNVFPKFNSNLSDDCLVKIMMYLHRTKKLINPNIDTWLYWFNRKTLISPEHLKWNGSLTMLSNIVQHICGECISETIRTVFCERKFVRPTRKEYEKGKTYKEIEQIIMISKQKNN